MLPGRHRSASLAGPARPRRRRGMPGLLTRQYIVNDHFLVTVATMTSHIMCLDLTLRSVNNCLSTSR
jgi:hypothetical protein